MSARSIWILFVAVGLLVAGTVGTTVRAQGRATTTIVRDSISHATFTRVLQRFVDEDGMVDYAGLKENLDGALAMYLTQLSTVNLSALDRAERLALWINAYNALTLHLVAEHYPIQNIWAITPGPPEPKDDSPFRLEVGTVADTVRTLDEIEHEIIRTRFSEPRIHFALVCAAKSCPRLRQRAYTADRMDDQLDDQARSFLHDAEKNRIPAGPRRIELSRILKWYGEDFGPSTDALQRSIAQYFEGDVRRNLKRAEYEVGYLPYDWALNAQSARTNGAGESAATKNAGGGRQP